MLLLRLLGKHHTLRLHPRRRSEHIVAPHRHRLRRPDPRLPVNISFQTLAENTGLSRSSTQSSIRWLLTRKLLTATKANATAIPTYTVQFPWRRP